MYITYFRPVDSTSLRAFVTICIPKWGDFLIRDIAYFVKGSHAWIGYPAKVYETDGKKKYWPYVAFASEELDKKFKDKVVDAIKEHIALHGEKAFPIVETQNPSSGENHAPF